MGDHISGFGKWLLSTVGALVVTAFLASKVWPQLQPLLTWQTITITVLLVLLVLASFRAGRRTAPQVVVERVVEREAEDSVPAFEPVRIDDTRAGMYYLLKRAPEEWVSRNLHDLTVGQIDRLIDGPFDAVNGCNGHLVRSEWEPYSGRTELLPARCPYCSRRVWEIPRSLSGPVPAVWRLQLAVLLRVQQGHRGGEALAARYSDIPYEAAGLSYVVATGMSIA